MTEYQRERFPIPTPGRLIRELRLRRPPWWMVLLLIIVVVGTWIPLAGIAQMRRTRSSLPKIHFIQDMDLQPSYRPQEPHAMFADGRSMREPIEGTVARGHLQLDDHLYRGYSTTPDAATGTDRIEFFTTIPEQITVNERLLQRGRDRFAIYCLVCHGEGGAGDGIVHQRAVAAKEDKWVAPNNLLTQEIRDRADGQLYQAIVDGVRSMPSYRTQVGVEDRWAIVAHVRQLQQNSPVAPPITPSSQ